MNAAVQNHLVRWLLRMYGWQSVAEQHHPLFLVIPLAHACVTALTPIRYAKCRSVRAYRYVRVGSGEC